MEARIAELEEEVGRLEVRIQMLEEYVQKVTADK
jgi:archaellum component FlaC